MTTHRSAPLHTLLEHEERERDAARARMHDARAQADHARAQADDLDRYRQDYGQRWSQQFRRQGTPEVLQCYQSYMQRLDQAVVQQAAVADHAQQRVDATVDTLRGHEQRVAAVRKLIERQQQVRDRAEQRAEQRRDDEFAQRSHARRAAGQAFVDGPDDVDPTAHATTFAERQDPEARTSS